MGPATTLQPATADQGFKTIPEPLQNTYTTDKSLHRQLSYLTQLGEEAISPQIHEWSADAERHQPYVRGYNVWGQRYDYDRVITSEGWKQLSSTALILSQQMQQQDFPATHPFTIIFNHLISRNKDFWTSSQWMTKRAGGSDVQDTETWATYNPIPASPSTSNNPLATLGEGEYSVSGFKFFSSATNTNVALLLAKTSPSGKVSTFLAPLRRTLTVPDNKRTHEVTNSVRIHRLKNKLRTKEVPTAELELHNMRAHLVGQRDKGVATIAPMLNVTCTHTFISSLGAWRRALSIAKSFARARITVGEALWLIPMHLRLLGELEIRHRAAMQLGFLMVGVMRVAENPAIGATVEEIPRHMPRENEVTVVFRTLTAVSKAVISKMAVLGIQECQEAMGGVGYMEEPDEPEFNVSRLLRNTAVNRIWEGTMNVLASEVVRFLLARDNFTVFAAWAEWVLGMIWTEGLALALNQAWAAFKGEVTRDVASVLADGRRVIFTLAWILIGGLLALDAERDEDEVAVEIARRWILAGEGGVGDTLHRGIMKPYGDVDANDHARWDCRIVWGMELPEGQLAGHCSLKNKL
ncbi:hypothetical protein CNMCM5623_003399 [Aspergillus felis]|uniref:Acyl-CoA dehydrogenase/oxidase C-terminal domain-containing protein n=1 Tax=Aspergillus felis TaxID=1287682 RepID=A0A8H6UY26_9EURO|nr:hypothetical protein CNMCM5623_003399 [Aspergillus felis]